MEPLSNLLDVLEQQRVLQGRDQGLEAELRFVQPDFATFERVERFLSGAGVQSEIEDSIDFRYASNNLRQTVVNGRGVWSRKERIWYQDLPEYQVRAALSRETVIAAPQSNANLVVDVVRIRHRQSFDLGTGARVDLTQIQTGRSVEDARQARPTVEIEVELLEPVNDATKQNLQALLLEMQHTTYPYPISIRNQTFEWININIFGVAGSGVGGSGSRVGPGSRQAPVRLDDRNLTRARNLKMLDVVPGGLVGNRQTPYTVTPKADGERRILVVAPTGIWLVAAPMTASLIMLPAMDDPLYTSLIGSALDGELIPAESRLPGAPSIDEVRYWFLVFDCIATNRNGRADTSIQREPHTGQSAPLTRMRTAQQIVDDLRQLGIPEFQIGTKSFTTLPNDAVAFFRTMNAALDFLQTLPYRNDGLVFTPANTVYNPHSEIDPATRRRRPLRDRVLTNVPDICKWKPPAQLTIDMLVAGTVERPQLLVMQDRQPVPFDANVQVLGITPQHIGRVVEFAWMGSAFQPQRVRLDKEYPNSLEAARSVWDDIRNPLTEETMRGQTLNFVRMYHNNIKRWLLRQVDEELKRNKLPRTLLDLGSGKGGDLSKWQGFDRVLAVEPNANNREEFMRRLNANPEMQKRVVGLLPVGAEDVDTIVERVRSTMPGGQVSCVAFMLSMSFLWRDEVMLQRVVQLLDQVLAPNGRVLFLTIDGRAVEALFRPALAGESVPQGQTLQLATAQLTLERSTLHINIPGTIVEDQTEYLVYLPDVERLSRFLTLDSLHQAWGTLDTRPIPALLSSDEMTFSRLFTFGTFRRNPTQKPPMVISSPLPRIPSPVATAPPPPPPARQAKKKGRNPVRAGRRRRRCILDPERPRFSLPILGFKRDGTPEMELLFVSAYYNMNTCTPIEPILRIAAAGDGTCLIHAVLGAISTEYQEADGEERRDMALDVRDELAVLLQAVDPTDPEGRTYYETVNNGALARMAQVMENEDDNPFELDALCDLFCSDAYLGDETFAILAQALGVYLFVLDTTELDSRLAYRNWEQGEVGRAVVIVNVGGHYETVGLVRDGDRVQTIFDVGNAQQTDPFITALVFESLNRGR